MATGDDQVTDMKLGIAGYFPHLPKTPAPIGAGAAVPDRTYHPESAHSFAGMPVESKKPHMVRRRLCSTKPQSST